jgi:signal peptidase II
MAAKGKRFSHYLYGWLLLALLALDQLAKALIRTLPAGERLSIIPGFLWLSHVRNTGSSFGLFQGWNGVLIWVSLLFLGLLLYYHDAFRTKAERVFMTLLFVGVLGNLVDRLFLGFVTDIVDLGWFPVFNVADTCLTIGVIGLILYELFWKKRSAERKDATR